MGTVSKALKLLDFFSSSRREIGLSEFTRLSGVNKATVFRLLSELQAHGFVEQSGIGREYRLGPAVLRLASLREAAVPTREVAMSVTRQLSDATGETSHLSLVNGDRLSTLVYAYSAAHGTRVIMDDAEVLPFHATSSGLAVLAFSEPEFVDQVLAQPLEQFTAETPTDSDDVRTLLEPVRKVGLANSVGGFEEEVNSFAVPLFNASAACIGALAVAVPVARMTEHLSTEIKILLPRKAQEIVDLLGGFLPPELQKAWANAN